MNIVSNNELIVWIQLDNKFFNIDRSICIGCIYIPPEGSSYIATTEKCFTSIETEVMKFSVDSDIFLCGDLNARTCDYNDFSNPIPGNNGPLNSHDYLVQHDSRSTIPSATLVKRSSQDLSRPNRYGKELLNLCKSSNLLICNGRFGQDQGTGKFTCFTARGMSVVDYLIASYSGVRYLKKFTVESLRAESDHCPIMYNLNIKYSINSTCSRKTTVTGQGITYYKWDDTRISKYFEQLTSEVSCEKL